MKTEVISMHIYKTIAITALTKQGMSRKIDKTINKKTQEGYEFVQIIGEPSDYVLVLFRIDSDFEMNPKKAKKEKTIVVNNKKEPKIASLSKQESVVPDTPFENDSLKTDVLEKDNQNPAPLEKDDQTIPVSDNENTKKAFLNAFKKKQKSNE